MMTRKNGTWEVYSHFFMSRFYLPLICGKPYWISNASKAIPSIFSAESKTL